jgi:uncharacterized membrane protein
MDERLPAPAERFLRSLNKALWTLASDERDSILLELRGHLADRAALDGRALEDALKELGTPEALAAAFDHDRGAGLARVPESHSGPRRPMSVGEVVAEVRATWRAARNGLVLVGAVLVTTLVATDFLSWMSIRLPEVGVGIAWVTAVRVLAVLLALCAGYRLVLADRVAPWSFGRSTPAFSAALAAATAVTIGGTLLIVRGSGAAFTALGLAGSAVPVLKAVATVVTLAAYSCLLLRVQPWLAALAAERDGFTLRDSWEGTRGRMGNVLRGWAALVLPLYLAHVLLNLVALRLLPFGPGTLALAGVDGIASAGVAIATILLNSTVFRWAAGEPIPAPRPFGNESPPAELVEQARIRLRPLLRRQPVSAA